MDFKFIDVKDKPDDWPANARENNLENIYKAVNNFCSEPSYRTKEVLLSLISVYDYNQNIAIGKHRITDYEVSMINSLYYNGLFMQLESLRCYLYELVGETARLQKMVSYMMNTQEIEDSIFVKPYDEGLCLPLKLYYYCYHAFTVYKDKPFADKIIEIVSDIKQTITESNISDVDKEEQIGELYKNYSIMLNDLSYFHGNKSENVWKFSREELYKLFSFEAMLVKDLKLNPMIRPLFGVLMTQMSNFILKSRHDYNQDYICKYISQTNAGLSMINHQIWLNRIDNLNDEREGNVIKELLDDVSWMDVPWVNSLDLSPQRTYYVSSFSKSINNSNMNKDYGEIVFGFKNDRIVDLLSPIYKAGKNVFFSHVLAFDVIYDVEDLKEEIKYVTQIIDLFDMDDESKNGFFQSLLQYWLLSAKDSKWKNERERRYVIFLYDEYDYIDLLIEDDFLKLKTSMFLLPDFAIGSYVGKDFSEEQITIKRKSVSYRPYLYCNDCFNRDYDVVSDANSNTIHCPICGSKNTELIVPQQN